MDAPTVAVVIVTVCAAVYDPVVGDIVGVATVEINGTPLTSFERAPITPFFTAAIL